VSEVAGPLPWITEDDLVEQREALPALEFSRLHLNQWADPPDRVGDPDDVRACITLDGPQLPAKGVRYVIGLDLGLVSDRTALAVCHIDDDVVVLDRIIVWQGSRGAPVSIETIEATVAYAAQEFNNARIVADPWQTAQLRERLRRRGLKVNEFKFSAQSVGKLATTLNVLLREHRLALPGDEDLIDELLHVRLRETSPGVVRLDHDSDRHDDRVIALALAAEHLLYSKRTSVTPVAIPIMWAPSPWRM
jgi:phage terminase large subunit-like protein